MTEHLFTKHLKKKFILFTITNLVSLFAYAEKTDKSFAKGLQPSIIYLASNTSSFKYSINNENVDSESSTYSYPGFGLRFGNISNDGFGFTIGGWIEPRRAWPDGKVNEDGSKSNVTGTVLIFDPCITMELSDAYIIGGVNYSMPMLSGLPDGQTMSGEFGWQAGVGWLLGHSIRNIDISPSNILLEIQFQHLEWTINNVTFDDDKKANISTNGIKLSLVIDL